MLQMRDDMYDGEPQPRLSSVIRIGEVTSVSAGGLTARVTFDDDDGVTSYDLPVLQRNTLRNHDYAHVDVGEDVVCLMLPTGVSEGFILGSWYAGDVTPPQSSGDVREVEFDDGTILRYDRSEHKLTADVKGDAEVTLTGKADVTAQGAISITSAEKVAITAPKIVLNGAITSYSRTGGSGTMKVTGTLEVTGNVTGDADVTASGISLKSHTHTCSDGGTTSTPN